MTWPTLIFLTLCVQTMAFSRKSKHFELENHPNWELLPHDNCGPQLTLPERERRYYNTKIPYFGEFPWMVLLFETQKHQKYDIWNCAGSIINNRYILTSAFCCKLLSPEQSRIRIGEYNVSHDGAECGPHWCADPVKNLKIEEITIHNKHSFSPYNGVCLIRTRSRIHFNEFVSPICLPLYDVIAHSINEETDLQLVEWLPPVYQSSQLKLNLTVLPNKYCAFSTEYGYDDPNKICTKQNNMHSSLGRKTCVGNLGNVLIKSLAVEDQQVTYAFGLLTESSIYSISRCMEGYPRLFCRLSSYTKWILDSIKP